MEIFLKNMLSRKIWCKRKKEIKAERERRRERERKRTFRRRHFYNNFVVKGVVKGTELMSGKKEESNQIFEEKVSSEESQDSFSTLEICCFHALSAPCSIDWFFLDIFTLFQISWVTTLISISRSLRLRGSYYCISLFSLSFARKAFDFMLVILSWDFLFSRNLKNFRKFND